MKNITSDKEFKYLILNESDKKYGITVNTVGFQSIHPNDVYPVKEHPKGYYFNKNSGRILNEYQLIYITKGEGELLIESEKKHNIHAGKLIILFPNQLHTYSPDKLVGWNEYYIGFKGDIIQSLVKNTFLTTQSQIIDVGLNEELVSLFKRALELVNQNNIGLQQHLSGIVMHMIGLVLYESSQNSEELLNYQQLIENAKIIMIENIYNGITPEALATRLNVNYTQFRKLFKKITGLAPAHYFQELKMRKAKQILLETSYQVKEISYSLNYNNIETFVTIFKKLTGYTPTEYRQFSRQ